MAESSAAEKSPSDIILGSHSADVVHFNGSDDPFNPANWPFPKKFVTSALYGLMSFGSVWACAIYASSNSQIAAEFHVSPVIGTSLLNFGDSLDRHPLHVRRSVVVDILDIPQQGNTFVGYTLVVCVILSIVSSSDVSVSFTILDNGILQILILPRDPTGNPSLHAEWKENTISVKELIVNDQIWPAPPSAANDTNLLRHHRLTFHSSTAYSTPASYLSLSSSRKLGAGTGFSHS
ncbi:hypothetical protein PAAG_12661 [Paracoccidioides lutzii Pb01]|uniref:Uncharacterized protein n=1 Tax=Paracoccidioides lutzii (strain ATCC MYA-826 / Pb01) TaxID=502779 RepID=A0A0A2UYP3_PARBA|nr:hypothetical protein PAAG_12661 [Paracoccidioides lutzii Pb01]KGQ00671.1 hypothetical protein PAAG_12661 [Paracoccidioides lutzii Pb01]